MVTVLPATPRFAASSEETVFKAIVGQLLEDDLLIVGQRVTDHAKDHEIDFLVAIAGAGIVCVEVKGGEVWHDGTSWWQERAGQSAKRIDPVGQARGGCYALREFVESDPRWTQGRVRWDHMAVFPHSEVGPAFALADCPRWKIVDRNQIEQISPLIREVLLQKVGSLPVLDGPGIEQLATVLSGRGLPQRDVVARALENEEVADALTSQQAVILRAAHQLRRVEIRGGAGSGKTFLAIEQARRLARDGQRVALVCYSHGLASYLERLTATWSRKERPAYVGEFHELGITWGAASGPDEQERTKAASDFWEYTLPQQMYELAQALSPGRRFDAIVVDEAQDFADEWWKPMLACLRDEDTSGIFVFSDEAQRVFARQGSPPVDLVPLVLDHNLRNTKQIAEAFKPLVGQRMRLNGGDGPSVRFIACTAEEALGVADDQIDPLLEDGWRPEDIALLTTGSRHEEQKARQSQGNREYWSSFWDAEQVFYGHVLGFKGLERRVIVLALNEEKSWERSRERLYVGLSRARDQLIVCGDPQFVLEVGGPEVARRLVPSGDGTRRSR
ncbi:MULTISPECIES: nuclease-related domain-containing DEAD/DEAH box helicase [Gordonia]|uniref:nuclease-related domain-containing DEAD/DEAH box helicase n=1 Tax=Gordonia TaxID=2053 RepID=UPI001FF86155|nr:MULTISPECIES: nuclease-related domain-containing DEAD/DEAH box helicase [Gordonia]MCT1352574.1 NERD domain-containing protein [Gordonia sp. p3-SID1431]UPG68682.1 NERD domain-containing protein [Gordonia hongkongensis]